MKIGAVMFFTTDSMRPAPLAMELEKRGFESLWVPEHTHIPSSRKTAYPAGGGLIRPYYDIMDPFLVLNAAATVTTKLKVGTGIALIVQRDPIVTAKEVASLDFLSNGRFIFGIGGGWNAEEMEHHGTVFKSRWKKMREQITAMKKIWAEDEPEFHGEFVNFDKLWSWPKPVQKPHPPILLGGHSPQMLKRVVDYCDGWMPIGARAGQFEESLAELRRLAEEKGRDPKTVSVTIFGAPADEERLQRYQELGVERVAFGLPSADKDAVLPLMDRYAEVVRKLG